ncbi:HNH endonuclease [Actinomadura gamaensis]|uniref:HNH endonuclease n=1 Tax=Actinomadura gamaensis TaxID=1763541 RepID=A0ABV9TX91_9ACTN
MISTDFFRVDPTPLASWRMAVLMGANSRTYKFALGDALLRAAGEDRTEIPLAELALAYSSGLLDHIAQAPQASPKAPQGENDFLALAAAEAEESRGIGRPTEKLVDAAMVNMPRMVMQKFHNVAGGEIPHRFYELRGSRRDRVVLLTPELRAVARSEQAALLGDELSARWSIVETSFSTGIGASLMADGLVVDHAEQRLYDKRRRRPVAGVRAALSGFRHGRCLLCDQVLTPGDEDDVEHLFPFFLMNRYGKAGRWTGPDLDSVWNLAPSHRACNLGKGTRLPTGDQMARLAMRNEEIMKSPHPLKRTLALTLARNNHDPGVPGVWTTFIKRVYADIVS